jgi:antitoxin component of MazEF toxin-antitoxin module
MGRRKTHEENIRKITRSGSSYALTIPISVMRELGWQEKQRVVVEKSGEGFLVRDYK